jgi:hypothetical protein
LCGIEENLCSLIILRGIESHVVRKIVMEQEPGQDEESTVSWERYMQTEGLCQHIHCQFCDSKEKTLVVV